MSRTITYGVLTIVMLIWGLNMVALKYMVEQLSPIAMQGLRIGLAGFVTITVLYFLRDLRRMSKKEWLYTFLAALLGQVLHHSLLALGLVETTSSNASLIVALNPLMTAVLALLFLHERLSILRVIGIGLGFAGVAIVVLQNGNAAGLGNISRGDVLVFLSSLAQAASFILIKKATATLSPRQMTAMMLLIGSAVLMLTSYFLEEAGVGQFVQAPPLFWMIFLLSAILATGLGHLLYNQAIKQIGAEQTAIFNNLVPFFALLGAYFFLGETIHFPQILGFILIVSGVILGTGYLEKV